MPDTIQFGQPFSRQRKRLHEEVADYLWQSILESELQAGAPLTSERELAEQLAVSRPTISSAIRLLEQRGLVEVRVGNGTYVSDRARSAFVDSMARLAAFHNCSFQELMTLREMIEPEIAALTADNATADDLATIGGFLEEAEDTWRRGDARKNVVADAGFHEALAEATGNRLVTAITVGLHRLMLQALDIQYRVGTREHGILSHRPIFQAIVARDPEGARKAMNEHMRYTRLALQDATDGSLAEADSQTEPNQGARPGRGK